MTDAFLFLSVRSARNALRARAARLREPRYAIGLLFGLGYLFMVFGRSLLRMSTRATAHAPGPIAMFLTDFRVPLEVLGAAALALLAAAAWFFPGSSRPPLAFTRSEVQFLFPAPITRRQLIHYKILRSQGAAAISSLIVTLLVHLGDLGAAWMSFVGIWVVIVSVNLHLTGVELRRQSLRDHGRAGLKHQMVPLAIVLGVVLVIATAVISNWVVLSGLDGAGAVLHEIGRMGRTSPVRELLFLLTSLVRLPLSTTPGDFFAALPIAAAVVLANYVWVVRSDAAFEESAATFAEHMAELRGRVSAGREASAPRVKAEPFHLRPIGRPEVAFLWKNLIMMGRYANMAYAIRIALAFVVVLAMASSRGRAPAELAARLCVFGAGLATLFGAQWVRSDLRRDLSHLAVLRSWPVSGPAIVRGEVLATTAVLTVVVWILVLGALACGAGAFPRTPLLALHRVSLGIGAMIVAPGIILTQIVACNAVAAIFPAWSSTVTSRARGLDVAGQRMLMVGGMLLTLAIALVPAVLLAGIVGLGIRAIVGIQPVIVPALVATGVLVVENALACEAVGRLLDRADLATLPPAP